MALKGRVLMRRINVDEVHFGTHEVHGGTQVEPSRSRQGCSTAQIFYPCWELGEKMGLTGGADLVIFPGGRRAFLGLSSGKNWSPLSSSGKG